MSREAAVDSNNAYIIGGSHHGLMSVGRVVSWTMRPSACHRPVDHQKNPIHDLWESVSNLPDNVHCTSAIPWLATIHLCDSPAREVQPPVRADFLRHPNPRPPIPHCLSFDKIDLQSTDGDFQQVTTDYEHRRRILTLVCGPSQCLQGQ